MNHIFTCICLFVLVTFSLSGEHQEPNHYFAAPTLHVFLAGTGVVGSEFIDQIEKNQESLELKYGNKIVIVGIANSKSMCFNPEGISLKTWRSKLEQSEQKMSIDHFIEVMTNFHFPNSVFVDCTSNQTIADAYLDVIKEGISIVTPNKKANSGTLESYLALKEELAKRQAQFFYDSNVGAGLPILSTVNSLMRSGDEIVKIEAILSGTLSYLFNNYDGSVPFSKLVKNAQNMGYTEPDPRDDLNGMDVARKLLILARESGAALEMEQIDLQRFLPDDCFDACCVHEFYQNLVSYDEAFDEIRKAAEAQGKRLRFIASYENGKASISLQQVGEQHPFYHLSGNDNIIAITTKYYSKNPLVIQGPGAGAEVTAARIVEGVVNIGLN